MVRRLLTVLLALALAMGLSASAELTSGTYLKPTAEEYPIDLSEFKIINILLMGDTPDDFDMVLDYINGIMHEQFNTEIAPTQVSWSDLSRMYPLYITGGEDLDIVFTQNLRYLFNYAAQETWFTFSEDFIAEYMPYTAKYQNKAAFDMAKYKGGIVGIPQNETASGGASPHLSVRNDVMERYGVGEISSYQDVYDLWMTIAADKDQTMLAFNAGKQESYPISLQQTGDGYIRTNATNVNYIWKDGELPTADELFFTYAAPEYKDYVANSKALADAGVWSRSVLSKDAINYESFYNGDSCTGAFNGTMYRYAYMLETSTGMGAKTFLIRGEKGQCVNEAYSQNCLSIHVGAKDIKRCAMVIDIMKFHTEINHAIQYGILDYHYTIDDEGTPQLTENSSRYPAYAWCPSWAVKNGDLLGSYYTQEQKEADQYLATIAVNNPAFAFVPDTESVKAYTGAITAVIEEYSYSLGLGLIDDPEKSCAEFLDKLTEAGMDIYMDEVKAQYAEWYNDL